MFQTLHNRCGHYPLLLAVAVALTLPNLGVPSLWDIDEGNNAEAAREMLDCGNWVVPTFNYQLRVDKPALLYWLQMGAFRLFGVNELAARLPSALAALAAVLMTYELGRQMFGAATGLLAGLILASAGLFCCAAHFANPDALLNAFTLLTLLSYWQSVVHPLIPPACQAEAGENRLRRMAWSVTGAISAGLAVLSKGPVGLVLPLAVIALFLLWGRSLRLRWERRFLWTALAFVLVALPWYVWVGVDTKVAFLRAFFFKHNVERFLYPLEHHSGPVYYYVGALVLGFAPWSAFLGLAGWYGTGARARNDLGVRTTRRFCEPPLNGYRFLWSWITVYFVFFSLAGTKLPNYILPMYAPLAILTARFLERWRRGTVQPAAWAIHVSLAGVALCGLLTMLAFLVAGGMVHLPALEGWHLSGWSTGALLGLLPLAGAAAAGWCLSKGRRRGLVASIITSSILFIGGLVAWGGAAIEGSKAPRALVQAAGVRQTDHDIRVGCYQYFQPSLVFYCRREVQRLESEEQVLEFLHCPLPVYLFVPAMVWEKLEARINGPYRLLARHGDIYRRCDVVVVANR
jgi:4-amino-4-deoxy-L-arabinose transferase-like glycosyltransferase